MASKAASYPSWPSTSGSGLRRPCKRIRGGDPARKCRSEAPHASARSNKTSIWATCHRPSCSQHTGQHKIRQVHSPHNERHEQAHHEQQEWLENTGKDANAVIHLFSVHLGESEEHRIQLPRFFPDGHHVDGCGRKDRRLPQGKKRGSWKIGRAHV